MARRKLLLPWSWTKGNKSLSRAWWVWMSMELCKQGSRQVNLLLSQWRIQPGWKIKQGFMDQMGLNLWFHPTQLPIEHRLQDHEFQLLVIYLQQLNLIHFWHFNILDKVLVFSISKRNMHRKQLYSLMHTTHLKRIAD